MRGAYPSCSLRDPGSIKVLIEPRRHAPDDVAPVLRVLDQVAFIGIDGQLGGNAERLGRVPELERLRTRANKDDQAVDDGGHR